MKRLQSLAIGLMLITAATLNAQTGDVQRKPDDAVIQINPASKARIEFISDTWDFGSMPRGSVVAHAFKFKNVGQDTLIIGKVKPTCGCTTAPLSSNSVPPGGEATITASFDSEKFNGRVSKYIYVDSNDPIRPYLKISFTATINNPLQNIQPTPTEIDFGTVKLGSPAQSTIKILNAEEKAVKLAVVEQSVGATAVLSRSDIPKGDMADLVVNLAPQGFQGVVKQSITLEAENVPGSRFTIPWKANISMQ